jgi:hypothetical protein
LLGYASLHTIYGTALSVVFDLQVDIQKISFFYVPWLLAEERKQLSPPQKFIPHTMTDSEENMKK